MLKSLTLHNFRKVVYDKMLFSNGLNVIRGANESSKTTRIEAISYALFGSRVLRDSLDNTVTWGHPAKDLKVEVEYGDYTITRSKSGAEVVSMGQVLVTGQSEVTSFCEKLLGADATTAANLMLSNQMGLRGILTNGPKATAQLIEDLGEFDLFDKILDAAQHKLALGSGVALETRVRQLTADLEQMPDVPAPDAGAHVAAQKEAATQASILTADIAQTEQQAKGLSEAIHAEEHRRAQSSKLAGQVATLQRQLESVRADAAAVPAPGEVEDTTRLEAMVAGEIQFGARLRAYEKFIKLPHPARRDRAKMDGEIKAFQTEIKQADETVRQAQTNIKVAKVSLTTASTCGFCGQDVSQFPEVVKRNVELDASILAEERRADEALERKEGAERELEEVQAIFRAEDEILRGVRGIEQYLERDESVVPVLFRWVGEIPEEGDRPDYAGHLAEVKARNADTLQTRAKLDTLLKQEAQLQVQVAAAAEEHAKIHLMMDVEFDAMAIKLAELQQALRDLNKKLNELQHSIRDANHAFELAMEKFRNAQERKAKVASDLDAARKEVETLEFNNGLVKKIRSARPVIGNKLWTMVLSSVSTVFSQMRGEKSVVAKEKDGFTVNGRNIESLSGSTLDLLGLAIRCALVKTFVPGCPFLVLDEPSAAMDSDRTSAMLGYVAASGFKQVLLVTHEDVSESFANNLITL